LLQPETLAKVLDNAYDVKKKNLAYRRCTMWAIEEGIQRLKSSGGKITAQRIAILKLLAGRKDHPSADVICNELRQFFPTISYATIYGTAQLLADLGLINILTIDDKRILFDPETTFHAHFRCTNCGAIIDVPFDTGNMGAFFPHLHHKVENSQVYLYGTCEHCLLGDTTQKGAHLSIH